MSENKVGEENRGNPEKPNRRTYPKAQERITRKKEAVLRSLKASGGMFNLACRDAKISKTQVYAWMKEDDEFRESVEAEQDIELRLDVCESVVFNMAANDNLKAAMFILTQLGGRRGYGTRVEMKVSVPPIRIFQTDVERNNEWS